MLVMVQSGSRVRQDSRKFPSCGSVMGASVSVARVRRAGRSFHVGRADSASGERLAIVEAGRPQEERAALTRGARPEVGRLRAVQAGAWAWRRARSEVSCETIRSVSASRWARAWAET